MIRVQEIQFDYYRGMEAEQYSFYRVPKVLFTAECFKGLSCEAKVLYGLMLDRMSLSIRNRWFDDEDRAYIIFTVEDIMELMNCGRQKAIKTIAELDNEKGIGLIEKKRLGLGKPNVIYVKNFVIKEVPAAQQADSEHTQDGEQAETAVNAQKCENPISRSTESGFQEVPESDFQKYENQTSGSMKNGLHEVPESNLQKCEKGTSGGAKIILQEVPKSKCNKTDNNYTDFSENEYIQSNPIYTDDRTVDVMDEMEAYRSIIRENISYDCFQNDAPYELNEVDELVELMVDVMVMPDHGTIRIAGEDKSVPVVKSRFLKLTHSHIEYVRFCLQKNTTKVGNIKAYLLTTLYNSLFTIDHFYQAEVNHDMYGGES
jgi:hypothetical protein